MAAAAGKGQHTHLQDLRPAGRVRQRHVDDAVKAARPDERRVDGTRSVGGAEDDDAVVVLHAVHLDLNVWEEVWEQGVGARCGMGVDMQFCWRGCV